MAKIVWTFITDFAHGVIDAIHGLTFLLDLDHDEEYVPINDVPLKSPVTVLLHRRAVGKLLKKAEQEGIESLKNVEKKPEGQIMRHRERAWKRVLQCAAFNLLFVLILKLLSLILALFIGFFWDVSYADFLSHFFCLPIFLVSRILLALWFSDISGACLRRMNAPDPKPVCWKQVVADMMSSILLGVLFLLQSLGAEYLPLPIITPIISFVHMSLLNSMYSFEYLWSSRNVTRPERVMRIESKWPYFVGFGAPLTLASSLTSSFLVNGCIFASVFPFFIISTYMAHWDRKYPGAEVPVVRIFTPSELITRKITLLITSYVIPEGLTVGLHKGFHATQIERKPRQNRRKGVASKKTKVVRELVREIAGFAPYERRVLEMLRISKDKRALKFLKKRIGTHLRAKKKREELQNVIVAQRKHHK
ncbi:unnamed protein product [Caenorhabditis auriculariae]|uniref:60S ribosomal protein L36 n=1 Tax=Caenorhabditis auriculariae TaxID=2777116 RepID=A0A8S1HY69_9PELO|nr:unnamed protein product [Caenorhabditis auriculariae]